MLKKSANNCFCTRLLRVNELDYIVKLKLSFNLNKVEGVLCIDQDKDTDEILNKVHIKGFMICKQ